MHASDLLLELQQFKYDSSAEAVARKREILGALAVKRFGSADEVLAFHDALCFMRAYSPSLEMRDQVGGILATFSERKDLLRFVRRLDDTGVAGTRTHFRFYWLTATWLLKQGWGDRLTVDWSEFGHKEKLSEIYHLLMPFCESPALDSLDLTPQEWTEKFKAPDETDAAFLIRRFDALEVPTPVRERLYEELDIPMVLAAGDPAAGDPAPDATTSARSHSEWKGARVVVPAALPQKSRPNMRTAIRDANFTVRKLDAREGRRLIDLANSCMVPRHRDLLIFLHADPKDARLVDFGDGLQFLCVGAVPERRLMLESVYGFLTLMNGFPIGYVLCSAFFNSSEVAYNVFETFRGRGAAHTYARILAMVQQLFGSDTFSLDPYQLGHNNDEGLDSGAWWFYYKLGFRPHDGHIKKLVREELAKMKKNPKHRTTRARLNELSSEYMFLHLDKPRTDVLGALSIGNIGSAITAKLAARFGGERERGIKIVSAEIAKMLGQRGKLTGGEKLAWDRWAPVVDALDGVEKWSASEKNALAAVMRAKGGKSEAKYVALFDQHKKLRAALMALSQDS